MCEGGGGGGGGVGIAFVSETDIAVTGYRRLYLCGRFFEQKMADVVGCTTPEGEICEVNTYLVYLT